jgi:chromosome segregation ATPase
VLRLKGWIAAVAADPAAMLFVVAVVLLIAILVAMAFAARARRRDDHRERVESAPAPESSGPVAIAPWVEEGRQLFTHWQDRIERLGELQGRLAAMAQEIEQLKAQAGAQTGRIDELRAENLRLGQEAEAFSMERDQLRAVLARISELVRQASEARPSVAGEATPGAGP